MCCTYSSQHIPYGKFLINGSQLQRLFSRQMIAWAYAASVFRTVINLTKVFWGAEGSISSPFVYAVAILEDQAP